MNTTRNLIKALMFAIMFGWSSPGWAGPENDYFTNSFHLLGVNVSTNGDNGTATLEAGETLPLAGGAGRTLWYSWEAPVKGRVRISSGSCCMNGALALYQGDNLASLRRLVAGQDSLIFLTEAGMVYHIQVDGAAGNSAAFSLTIQTTPATPPTNDFFADAAGLFGTSAEHTAWIDDATLQLGEPAHRGAVSSKSLWWSWQVPMNGTVSLNALGSLATNLTVAVYTGNSAETLSLVAKRTNSAVQFTAAGGTVYRVAAVALQETSGDVVMRVQNSTAFGGTPSLAVPGNLLLEPSFEGTGLGLAHWQISTASFGGGYVGERGGADGTTWIVLVNDVSMWQDFATIPGRNYHVNFAFRPDFWASTGKVRIWWDDREVGIGQALGTYWHWTNVIVTASNTLSRLKVEVIEGALGLDGFSVVPSQSPPAIVTQPQSLSTFEGGAITFLVGVSGSAPLSYRWYSPAGLIPNQTSQVLSLEDVTPADAGSYYSVITNAFGVVTSSVVNLAVETPTSPTIVLQPYSQFVPAGGYAVLSVAAVGTPPLAYQWYMNGDLLAGATNRQLIFPAFNATNAGNYSAQVANYAQSAWSLSASLNVDTNAVGGGALLLGNEIPDGGFTRKAPVFDLDGMTKLSGGTYLAQLYAGPDLPGLRPVGAPREFRVGFAAGLIDPLAIELPNVPFGQIAYAQVRVWQSARGASYEEARALGSKFGKSEILQINPGVMPNPPPLWGLQSFSLRAGLPEFNAGRIDYVGVNPDGSIRWQLTGNAGYRYVIEKSSSGTLWSPFLILTNTLSTATFNDFATNNLGGQFYRARILE